MTKAKTRELRECVAILEDLGAMGMTHKQASNLLKLMQKLRKLAE